MHICTQEKELVWRERMSHLKHGVEEKSRDVVTGFLALFGRDGRIVRHFLFLFFIFVTLLFI